jgi:fatty acid desaturase
MEADMADDDRTRRARQIAEARYGFMWHLPIYLIVNAGLVMVWLFSGEGFPWPLFPIVFWGMGVFAHYFAAYRMSGVGWIERETQKILGEEGTGSQGR